MSNGTQTKLLLWRNGSHKSPFRNMLPNDSGLSTGSTNDLMRTSLSAGGLTENFDKINRHIGSGMPTTDAITGPRVCVKFHLVLRNMGRNTPCDRATSDIRVLSFQQSEAIAGYK